MSKGMERNGKDMYVLILQKCHGYYSITESFRHIAVN